MLADAPTPPAGQGDPLGEAFSMPFAGREVIVHLCPGARERVARLLVSLSNSSHAAIRSANQAADAGATSADRHYATWTQGLQGTKAYSLEAYDSKGR